MNNLEPPDSFYLRAACGWLELGDWQSANDELEMIAPRLRAHPSVLGVRYELYAKVGKWDDAAEIADTLTRLEPSNAVGWISLAYATRRKPGGGLPHAKIILEEAFKHFPKQATIRYNLACYCAQLGKLEEAKEWLHKAYEVGDPKKYKAMAICDPDLEPLFKGSGI